MTETTHSLGIERSDHPAALLEAAPGTNASLGMTSATFLRAYEAKHGVTFEALDREALAEVRMLWHRAADAEHPVAKAEAMADLASAVCDLLGLA